MDPRKRQRISAIIIAIVIVAMVVTSVVPMLIGKAADLDG